VPTPPLPELPGVRHRDVTARGVRLHVAEAGAGPPLLLLHGWPQHWWCWRHLIGPLAERYTVLAPDLRGWGWSEAPRDAYAKTTFMADVVALMDHEGIERARVIAHDWGGYTAFLLALEHPERVERMLALDIVPPWPGPPQPGLLRLPVFLSYQVLLASPLGAPVMTRGRGFIRSIVRLASGPDMHWSDTDLNLYADVLRDPDRARASSACYRTFLTREVGRAGYRASQLEVPTLLLMGGASTLQRTFRPQASRNLSVEVVPRAGHMLPEEAPEAVLTAARRFFTEP
jgi:pimeloyl-ACP methyl ester carboxylesterase